MSEERELNKRNDEQKIEEGEQNTEKASLKFAHKNV